MPQKELWHNFPKTLLLDVARSWLMKQKSNSQQIKLPEYGPHNHKIPLMEGKEPACKKIYAMSEKELKALKEYIDEQL